MNNDFPRIITFLRKERGLSQKQAAEDLGVSQALLSHYEKGIRACGMDFLIKAADYYEVSADYLLGRTLQRGASPDSDDFHHLKSSVMNQINQRLLTNTITIIYDLLTQLGDKNLANAVSSYLMNAEYQVFRAIYSADPSNPQDMFALDRNRFKGLSTAAMIINLERAVELMEREQLSLDLSPDILSGYFEQGASSLFNLIQFAERNAVGRKSMDS